jgi:FdrA protein
MRKFMKTKLEELLQNGPVVINLGVREFAESLQDQQVDVVHVDWAPPAGGDTEMAELLERLL